MIYGYCRVSTQDQDLIPQIETLQKYHPNIFIFQEKVSTSKQQIELNKLLQLIKQDDILVITELSRISRSLLALIQITNHFKLLNIKLVSLREGIDSSTPTGTLMMSLFATLYEFEKNTIKERTQRALASKRARGIIGGRPKVHSKIVQRALLDYQNNMPIKDILLQNKISRTTLYRYLKINP